MADPKPNFSEDHISGEEQIQKCLLEKRIGFDEISIITLQNLIQKAPKGETFIVPSDMKKHLYTDCAQRTERKDLKFVVESK
ncbi:MAG: hypothetical protein NTZ44_02695 [Candidatus Nomurabacteria bacterium]|nr:hypothetical protein [Candidatus Nomurabacteria bacterium]